MSLSSNILFYTMKIINGKKISAKSLYRPKRGINKLSTAKFGKHFHTVTQDINGFKIVTIKAKNNNCTNKHIIFLHGGAYTLEALSTHRKMIEKLCNNHHLTVSCINYPLSPEYQSEITLHILHESYKFLISKYTDDEFCLFGDSSGGGLALAFLQQLKEKNIKPFPTKTVLCF